MTCHSHLGCGHIELKGKIKYWKQSPNLKKLHTLIPYFGICGDFNCNLVERKLPYLVSCVLLPVCGRLDWVCVCVCVCGGGGGGGGGGGVG